MKKQFLILSLISLFASTAAIAQDVDVTIASDDFSTCNGSLNDTNPIGYYAANEDETITICAEAPETIVNLYWISFDLGAGDVLQIFDGADVSAPLIGSYTGQDLALLDITSTNATGCLTLHWTSDATDEGEFGCIVNCGAPCLKPVSAIVATGETIVPILACKDEQFTFDASGTVFQNGATFQSVLWDFGDGTTANAGWPTVQHSYPASGIYKVNVYVTDSNGCQSLNVVNLKLYVSTDPIFSAVATDDLVCVGQEVDFNGYAEGVTYDNVPNAGFGGGLYIPDNQGCFSDTLYITGFEPGQTIGSISDINSFYINYEHSYMSDFTISFFCPDGSGLVAHSQGAGGFFNGIACDNTTPNSPGTGWDYWWAPDAVNPTWAAAVVLPEFQTVVNDPCTGNDYTSLTSGTYAAVGDWSALVGCPLNGPWIIEICDIVGADDGYIFDWSVNFDGSLYPEDLTFTPTFDSSCTDTYWTGDFIIDNNTNCDSVLVVPGAAGPHTYTYTAVNNHGCVYTQDINIVAYDGPVPSAGPDVYYCNEQLVLDGSVTNPQTGLNYVYAWSPAAPLNSSSISDPTITSLNITQEFILSVYPTDDADCIVSDTVLVTIPATPPANPLDTLTFCSDTNINLTAPGEGQPGFYYYWYYSADGEDFEQVSNNALGTLAIAESGIYYVEVEEPYCQFTSTTYFLSIIEDCEIIIPNVFTPNDDSRNDTFEIFGLSKYPQSTIQIYNRWGKLIYENSNYFNQWDGKDSAAGTYYYILGVNKDNEYEYFEGHLTLLRD
jgi:gliding motility-associated-like protein